MAELWWTEARVEELTRRWNANESGRVIAAAMGATSRCAVIGKARRLGLAYHGPANGIVKARKPAMKRKRTVREKNSFDQFSVVHDADAVVEECPTTFANPKSLMDLVATDCRWPGAGEPTAVMLYCAAPVLDGFPYCARHCRVAYIPRRGR
jgi:GcrA cell cycle regulator